MSATTPAGQEARRALLYAALALLNGEEPGPLTGTRIAELAGVKRHRLVNDNPDIVADFNEHVRSMNRSQPALDEARQDAARLKQRNTELRQENASLKARNALYATRIVELIRERDALIRSAQQDKNVIGIGDRGRHAP